MKLERMMTQEENGFNCRARFIALEFSSWAAGSLKEAFEK